MAVIDIGTEAIAQGGYTCRTNINLNNPANATGKITSVEIYCSSNILGGKVATVFEVSPGYYSVRDWVSIGTVVAGAKRTFSVELNVQIGDYIAVGGYSGTISSYHTGYDGIAYYGTDVIPFTNQSFTIYPGYRISLYGTGVSPTLPTVSVQAVTDIDETTATGNGNITNTGYPWANCTKRGICWNTTGNPTRADNKSEETGSFGTGAFSRPITGLTKAQRYYVKAYALSSAGYGYSSQIEFNAYPGGYDITYYNNNAVYTTAWEATSADMWSRGNLMVGQLRLAQFRVGRSYFWLDTSSLPSNLVIASAKLYIYNRNILTDYNNNFYIKIQRGTELDEDDIPVVHHKPVPDYVVEDYDKGLVSGNGGEIHASNIPEVAEYFPIELNSVGITWINKGTGAISKFCLRTDQDIDGIVPVADVNKCLFVRGAYGTDLSYDPYLEIVALVAPTNVQATDGAHTDKVVVTWTKSPGATGYQVYRDDVALGWLGDVDTYDDTEAGAPSITPGSAVASDGTHADKVALSLSGTSANDGTTHTYKVRARNVNEEEGDDSETDSGYRGVGSLIYQWYRSAGDSNASYSNISGATSSTYNDMSTPAGSIPGTPIGLTATDGVHTDKVALAWINVSGSDGEGRYYKCYLTAEGATPGYTSANRGYRGAYTLTDVQVKRDTTELDAVGSLATSYDDTGADPPTITPGVAAASDGISVNYVALSLTGQTTVNGTTHNYYVRTYNEVGWGSWTSANAGYRGVGTLTYQWQRSAGDSDVAHSNISGAITASYNDTDAPADGSGRYYRCVEDATGATQQISTSDRGYRMYSPTVVTQAANSLTGASATLNGNITDAGGPITTRGFQYYKEGDSGNVLDVHEDGTFGEGVYGLSISGLVNGTKYYFRAYATNDAGTSYGDALDFTTEVYLPLVTTELPSDIDIDHAKGNGTIILGANIIERGFEVVLVFSGALQEYTDRKMAGFAGTATYSGTTKKWEGTLTKTITEAGTFGAGAFIGDIGRFPNAITSDRLFAGETYIYKARATNDVGVGYGSWVVLTTSSLLAGQLPDDQIPIDDVVGIFYYRKPYTKRDANELREKCRMFQDNIVEYALVINHNSRVLQRFLNDLTLYAGADEYNTFRPIIPPQYLNELARKPLNENDFKKIINSFINNSVDNANNVNNNFQLIRGGLSDYTYTEDEGFVDIAIRTKVIVDISPDVEGLTRVIDKLNKEMADNYLVINHNSHVLRSILI